MFRCDFFYEISTVFNYDLFIPIRFYLIGFMLYYSICLVVIRNEISTVFNYYLFKTIRSYFVIFLLFYSIHLDVIS
jgi:hypothetical protein